VDESDPVRAYEGTRIANERPGRKEAVGSGEIGAPVDHDAAFAGDVGERLGIREHHRVEPSVEMRYEIEQTALAASDPVLPVVYVQNGSGLRTHRKNLR